MRAIPVDGSRFQQPTTTSHRWPWAACHDLSEATGFSPTNPGSAGILAARRSRRSGNPWTLARWIPNIATWRELADHEKRAWKKDGSQESSTKIGLSYHDDHVIWVWVKFRLPEEWMVTNKKATWNAPWLTPVTARYIGDPSTPPIFHVASNHREKLKNHFLTRLCWPIGGFRHFISLYIHLYPVAILIQDSKKPSDHLSDLSAGWIFLLPPWLRGSPGYQLSNSLCCVRMAVFAAKFSSSAWAGKGSKSIGS